MSAVADRVQGMHSTYEDIVLHGGKKLALELGPAELPVPTLKRSITAASSIEVPLFDEDGDILRRSLLAEKWDAELDGLKFCYAALSKSGQQLTLTLEDLWIAKLREKEGPKKAYRSKVTRAEFIKRLVEEACPGLDFYCPQLHRKQKIKSKSAAEKAKAKAKENRSRGIGDSKHLKVKGQAATKAQRELGDTAIRIAESGNAPFVVKVALIAALIDESEMGAASHNVLQALGAGGAAKGAPEEEISGFLFGEPTWTGVTAVGYHKAHPKATYYEIAQAVQKSGAGESSSGRGNYGQFGEEAREWVEAYEGGSGSLTVTEPYIFDVKKKEDFWTAIKRLAKEVNWRAFVVANKFYFMPETELIAGMVRLAIDKDTPGVENVDFNYDTNKSVTEVTIEALVDQWKPPPGSVVTLADYGPASVGFGDAPVKAEKGQKAGLSSNRPAKTGEGKARYLVSSIEVPMSGDPAQRLARITLKKPTKPLPEPQSKTMSVSTGSSAEYTNPFPASEWTRERIDQGVDFGPKVNGAKILAPGDCVILKTGAPGWPEGGGVLFKLYGGSRKGDIVFIYETLTPVVHAGQKVNGGDVIAHAHTGGTGIEIGFADESGVPISHAKYIEGKETKGGKEMSKFLDEIGAP